MNPYKPDLTPVQQQAVDTERAAMLARLRAPPFSNGQRAGEFSVEWVKEWVDASGTLDQFLVQHVHDQRLDPAWQRLVDSWTGGDLTHEGRGSFHVYVPHAAYFAAAAGQRYGLPWHTSLACVGATLGRCVLVTVLAAAAAWLWSIDADA